MAELANKYEGDKLINSLADLLPKLDAWAQETYRSGTVQAITGVPRATFQFWITEGIYKTRHRPKRGEWREYGFWEMLKIDLLARLAKNGFELQIAHDIAEGVMQGCLKHPDKTQVFGDVWLVTRRDARSGEMRDAEDDPAFRVGTDNKPEMVINHLVHRCGSKAEMLDFIARAYDDEQRENDLYWPIPLGAWARDFLDSVGQWYAAYAKAERTVRAKIAAGEMVDERSAAS